MICAIFPPTQHAVTLHLFYSGTVLEPKVRSIDIPVRYSCKAPPWWSIYWFTYCAINNLTSRKINWPKSKGRIMLIFSWNNASDRQKTKPVCMPLMIVTVFTIILFSVITLGFTVSSSRRSIKPLTLIFRTRLWFLLPAGVWRCQGCSIAISWLLEYKGQTIAQVLLQ